MLNQNEFYNRRQALLAQLEENSVALLPAATLKMRNSDCSFRFRQDSSFLYLTGFEEANAVAVLTPGSDTPFILFNQPKNPEMELWDGALAGQTGAVELYGADLSHPIETLAQTLPDLLKNKTTLYVAFGLNEAFDNIVRNAINATRKHVRKGASAPTKLIDLSELLNEMRLIKSEAEIETMRRVAQISAEAHVKAMQAAAANKYEYELEAEITYHINKNGCQNYAYSPIVGAGANACVLHYIDNNQQIAEDDLILIDAGAELEGYAADITRTFPASGKFNDAQRAIYELVLKSQLAAIELVKPGTAWNELQETIVKVLTAGLVELGLLQGDIASLIKDGAYKAFYMHLSGHWLGLDTHDVGSYKKASAWRTLAPGMVLTVEPGLYIPASEAVDSRWWNIGVRIEDDILVTNEGYEVLTHAVPKTIAEIEALMA